MTLDELKALAKGADWIAHQDGCAWSPSSLSEAPCTCGADELAAALPVLIDVAKAAQAMANALDDSRAPFREHPRPLEEHNARFALNQALTALDKATR